MVLRWVQNGLYGDRVARTAIEKPPVFVIGHWRTGTTLLHELLAQDPQFGYPDFFSCFNPNHSLLSERFFKRYATFLAPEQRPMDNMAAGWDFNRRKTNSLCVFSAFPAPCRSRIFNRQPLYRLARPFRTLPEKRPGERTFAGSSRRSRIAIPRLVLKSPTFTARIRVLLSCSGCSVSSTSSAIRAS